MIRKVLHSGFRLGLQSRDIQNLYANSRYLNIANHDLLFNRILFQFSSNKNNQNSNQDKQPKKNQQQDNQEKLKKEEEQEKKKLQQSKNKLSSEYWKNYIDNFWQKHDPKDPNKKPTPKKEQIWKKVDDLFGTIAHNMKQLFYRKYTVRNILLATVLIYFLYNTFNNQTQLQPQNFIQMMQIKAFDEIIFVEQQYFRTNQIKKKKLEGRIGNDKYYCYVIDFEEILDYIIKDGTIKYKNQKRNRIEKMFNQIYLGMDTVLLLFIIGSIAMAPKSSLGGGGRMGPQMQQKKFELVKNVSIRFDDVAGLQQAKREVTQVVDFLKNPTKYHDLGATIPKGVLLTGPPGTGKTLLGKACAGEAGVPFFSVSGSDFVEVFVGVGASRVRELFVQAKENAPSIIFIDQLDAIGKKRQNKMGSNDERESTLNQLLVEMDGFGTNNSVIIMAATNRKQILDNALVRAGRFDREVEVGLPDLKGRCEILMVHLKPIKLSPKYTMEEYAKRIAALSPGFSGAQLANLCNQAAILAARCNKDLVYMLDFEISSERVIGGVERKGFVNLKEKKTVAYHESGHAVVSWFLQGADPLLKVTIIPRSKGSLGFAQYFVNENQLQTKQELLDRICFILGGRCAQEYFFKEITTGAYDDLQKAYNVAYNLVVKFGMDSNLGYIAFPDITYTKPYGQKVQARIDLVIKKILKECTEKTKKMIKEHQHHIRKQVYPYKSMAQQLLVKETIDVRQIQQILGPRPFKINKTFESYLQTVQTK